MRFEIKLNGYGKLLFGLAVGAMAGLFCHIQLVAAAELKINPAATVIKAGDELLVTVILDAAGSDINTIEAVLEYPADRLELSEIRTANSIITLWIAEPKNISPGRIVFGGTIIGGFIGNGGTVFSAVFKTPTQELVEPQIHIIALSGAKGYLNDGLGTNTELSLKSLRLTVEPSQGDTEPVEIEAIDDRTLPEPFSLEAARDQSIYENKWFIVFSAEDKQSGIAYYEVQETKYLTPQDDKWERATSPYLLRDQTRSSYFHVRAVDQAGNSRVATLAPLNQSGFRLSQYWLVAGLVVTIFIIFGIVVRLRNRRKDANVVV